MKYFQSNIKHLLKQHGIKSKDFAEKMGWTKESFSSYTTGRVIPKFDQVIKIATYFNVTTDDLANVDFRNSDIKRTETSTDANLIIELLTKEVITLREQIAREGDEEKNRRADEAVQDAINTLRQEDRK